MILLGLGMISVAADRNMLGGESFLLNGRAQAVKAEYFGLSAGQNNLAVEQNILELE